MKKITVGILAHVDAGKTTFIESLLYETGVISTIGRVDSRNSFLDTEGLERARGITIHSKNARITFPERNLEIILMDTPGHVDFAPEMERCLCILDVAILVLSANDGITAYTKTLFKLLDNYEIPTYIFVNKMDMPGVDKQQILNLIRKQLNENCIDFSAVNDEFYESIATADEWLLNEYLDTGGILREHICDSIGRRIIYPIFFGSALKQQGMDYFVNSFVTYLPDSSTVNMNSDEFSGIVYKISNEESGVRLTFIRIISGTIKVKDILNEEKINEIRLYSGEKFKCVKEAFAGDICALVSPKKTKVFDTFGNTDLKVKAHFLPVFRYALRYLEDLDIKIVFSRLRELCDEDPTLNVSFNEDAKEILVYLMGEVHAEILKATIKSRFDFDVEFADGRILYKETIDAACEGIGHYEPLRHYAEAHIMLEPNCRGIGMSFQADISEDILARNWQRLIYTHMTEKIHKGVLIGAPITDINLRLITGKSHLKHTEGGDFRQATYRAIRQGLMELKKTGHCHVLEPYYEYSLIIPTECVGRAMSDVNKMCGTFEISETDAINNTSTICGRCPVSTMNGYSKEVLSYSKGAGRLALNFSAYELCHNEEEVIEAFGYNPDADLDNPSSSVFCSHGAGHTVKWNEVLEYAHLPVL